MKQWSSLAHDIIHRWIDWCYDPRDSDTYRELSCRIAGDLGLNSSRHRGSHAFRFKTQSRPCSTGNLLYLSTISLALVLPSPPLFLHMAILAELDEHTPTKLPTIANYKKVVVSWLALFIRLAAFFTSSKFIRNLS